MLLAMHGSAASGIADSTAPLLPIRICGASLLQRYHWNPGSTTPAATNCKDGRPRSCCGLGSRRKKISRVCRGSNYKTAATSYRLAGGTSAAEAPRSRAWRSRIATHSRLNAKCCSGTIACSLPACRGSKSTDGRRGDDPQRTTRVVQGTEGGQREIFFAGQILMEASSPGSRRTSPNVVREFKLTNNVFKRRDAS